MNTEQVSNCWLSRSLIFSWVLFRSIEPVDYRSMFKHEMTLNDASSLLKSYFRYLPEPLVTFNGYDRLVVIGRRYQHFDFLYNNMKIRN